MSQMLRANARSKCSGRRAAKSISQMRRANALERSAPAAGPPKTIAGENVGNHIRPRADEVDCP